MDNCENCKHSSSSDDFIINCHLLDEIKQLKQENEELKEKLEIYRNPDVIKALTYYSCAEFEVIYKQNQELKQKLEKLKEICISEDYVFETKDVLRLDILKIIESEE